MLLLVLMVKKGRMFDFDCVCLFLVDYRISIYVVVFEVHRRKDLVSRDVA